MSNGDIYPDTGKTFSTARGDLAERLRFDEPLSSVVHDAADELERLQTLLAAVLRVVEDNDQWIDCGARIALRAVLTDSTAVQESDSHG